MSPPPPPPPRSAPRPALGLLAIAVAAALWALSAVVGRRLFDTGLDPVELSAARAWIAAVGLGAVEAWRRSRPTGEHRQGGSSGRDLLIVAALGVAIALVNASYYLAIERIDVAVALVVQYLGPAIVVAWTFLVTRRRPQPEVLLALAGSVVGVVLVSEVTAGAVGGVDALGFALALVAAVTFAAYTLLSESAGATHGVLRGLFLGFVAASATWLVVILLRGWPGSLFLPGHPAGVLFVGVGGTLVPFLLYLWAIQQVRAERASIAATLEPVLGALAAWLWLGQALSPQQLVGGALVILAVLSLQLRVAARRVGVEPVRGG